MDVEKKGMTDPNLEQWSHSAIASHLNRSWI